MPALSRTMDVGEEDAVIGTVDHVLDDLGRIDILVNNAGRGARIPAEQMPTETWQEVLQVNLTGTFLCTREVGRAMIDEGGGAIVNVASIMGLVGGGLYPNPAYQTTKGGIVNMTRALALDWAGHGIRVNAVAPTFAATPLTEGLLREPGMAAGQRRCRHDHRPYPAGGRRLDGALGPSPYAAVSPRTRGQAPPARQKGRAPCAFAM